ncbi:MAG: peptidyl-prolyl cis-trans isomerase [Chitinivibrionia bacterium]|nr:peptidyl-prolyl cis-trans isomerase [Chitinivibrionia bacterium]
MRVGRLFVALLVVGLALPFSCAKKQPSASEKEQLAAAVDSWKMTRSELNEIVENLPDNQKVKYNSQEGKAELAGMLIEEELYYKDALDKQMLKDEDIKKKVEDAARRIVINEYYAKYVTERAKPSDEEMYEYYQAHPERFTTQAVLRAQHIFSKDRKKLIDLKKRVEAGEKMTTLAHKFTEDELTRGDGGDLGYFNKGGYVRFIGYSKAWSDAVFDLEEGVLSDPIQFEKGYSIVRVNRKKPEELKSYEDVKGEISTLLVNNRITDVRKEVAAELSKSRKVTNYLREEIDRVQRSPEEMWNLAQTSTDSQRRLSMYQQIVDKYPESSYAPQALFMVGFVYAEELKDNYNAEQMFTKVVRDYPGTEIAKSAQWMLENLGKPMPDFENLDDLNKKISEQGQ